MKIKPHKGTANRIAIWPTSHDPKRKEHLPRTFSDYLQSVPLDERAGVIRRLIASGLLGRESQEIATAALEELEQGG